MNKTKLLIAALVIAGCADAFAGQMYRDALIEGIPHVTQKPDFCGEACVEMYLRGKGFKVDQDFVFDQSGLDPLKGRGCYTPELARAMKNIGFDAGDVWYFAAADKPAQMEAQWRELHRDLLRGVPSIVCMHYDNPPRASEHFRLVVGYDGKADEVIYHEPAEEGGGNRRMRRQRFIELWPLMYQPDRWTVIRLRLDPSHRAQDNVLTAATGLTNADYAQHIMRLKKKLPAEGFTILIERPFVVIGDEKPEVLKYRARKTVRWAVDKLKQDFFKKDLDEILDIWLFKDNESYRKHTKSIFNDDPTTPFGYYSPQHNALIMNIATGGGTLVHEIVHPFMRANFPACPAWFNEGIGSLYEQCREAGGHIHGSTNWRLAGLQKAIQAKQVPTFKKLTSTTDLQFYSRDSGTNYAHARYLCYYLQEQGLLVKFYHEFVANHKDDPTGYETLKKILETDDIDAFQKKWESFVLRLTFP